MRLNTFAVLWLVCWSSFSWCLCVIVCERACSHGYILAGSILASQALIWSSPHKVSLWCASAVASCHVQIKLYNQIESPPLNSLVVNSVIDQVRTFFSSPSLNPLSRSLECCLRSEAVLWGVLEGTHILQWLSLSVGDMRFFRRRLDCICDFLLDPLIL